MLPHQVDLIIKNTNNMFHEILTLTSNGHTQAHKNKIFSLSAQQTSKTPCHYIMFIYCTWILHSLNFQADLFSGALFITQTFKDLNLYVAVIILLAIAALFTITGEYNTLLCTLKALWSVTFVLVQYLCLEISIVQMAMHLFHFAFSYSQMLFNAQDSIYIYTN
jgi:hypothetical protein